MTIGDMPAAEVDVDAGLVRALLEAQHPDLAGLDLVALPTGWDNFMFRLGDELAVRLPRRQMSAVLVEHEQRWLPELATRLPLPIPVPRRVGHAALGFPWSWSVIPWLTGESAATVGPVDPFATAQQLGAFLAALHAPAPADAPENPYRGGPLADRAPAVYDRIELLRHVIDGAATARRWESVSATAPAAEPPRWIHGDLHPGNMLVAGGRISAIIDFGDITAGDRATDLSVAWMLLPPDARPMLRAAAGGCDDDTWARAQGWAIALALAYVAGSGNNPTMGRVGLHTLDAVLRDDSR